MPGGNGTGPMGMGPMTGRGRGRCTENAWPDQADDRPRRGRGRGRGFGRELAQRMGFGRNAGQTTPKAS